MATDFFYSEGYGPPAWIITPVETNSKPPAPKPEDKKLSPIELKVPFCCEECQENLKGALIELDGVDSVKLDPDTEKAIITGKVKPEDALKEAKKLDERSEFWPKKKEEEKKIDQLPKKGDLADNVQVVREQHSEVEKLRTEHSSLLEKSRDLAQEKRGGSREEKADFAGPKAEEGLWSGLFSRSAGSKTEHGPVRLEENSLERALFLNQYLLPRLRQSQISPGRSSILRQPKQRSPSLTSPKSLCS